MTALLLILSLLFSAPGKPYTGTQGTGAGTWTPPGIAQVQKKVYGSVSASTNHTVTFDSGPTQNNLLILTVVGDATASTPAGWSLATSQVQFVGIYIFYKVAGAGESSSITVTIGSSTNASMVAMEYSGMATSTPLDQVAGTNNYNGSAVPSGTTATTAQADELLVAAVGLSGGGGSIDSTTFSSWSNSFTEQGSGFGNAGATTTHVRNGTADRIVSATGAYSTTATISASTVSASAVIATFKKQ